MKIIMQPFLYRRTILYLQTWLRKPSFPVRLMSTKKQIHEINKPISESSVKPLNNFLSPVFRSAVTFKDKIALKDKNGHYTYERLLMASNRLAKLIDEKIGDSKQQRIAFLCPNDATYIMTQWASWLNGHIVVPLSPVHPPAMMDYFIRDCDANLIITTPEMQCAIEQTSAKTDRPVLILSDDLRVQSSLKPECSEESMKNKLMDLAAKHLDDSVPPKKEIVEYSRDIPAEFNVSVEKIVEKLPESFYKTNNAMIIYTSGSTGQPKGVLISHKNLNAQIKSMVNAWQWTPNDALLHCLPLHHIHGIVNGLLCPLAVGARCVMLPSFEASEVWKQLLGVKIAECERVNMFMGVPTMYVKLIEKYSQSLAKNERMVDYVRASCTQKMRIFISGSAPLPTQVFDKWHFITGHKILERYGMTETGMVLTNFLNSNRQPGSIGIPFPGVEVRIVDANGTVLARGSSRGSQIIDKNVKSVSGELHVKGDNVFTEYYRKPEQTRQAFSSGWFKTGDHVNFSEGEYKILGRQSIDIIKTGGYKVSAIHIETALRDHPDISDVAVVGVSDITWGQKVAAIVETSKGDNLNLLELSKWAKTKLPPYEVPTMFRIVKSIPRNPLGKVNKKDLADLVFSNQNQTELQK